MTVLRHTDFRNLFLGQSLSTLGETLGERAVLAAGTAVATLALAAGLLVRESRDLRRITWSQAPASQ
jgi:hypothetical protein